jgi:hypothetical protein
MHQLSLTEINPGERSEFVEILGDIYKASL